MRLSILDTGHRTRAGLFMRLTAKGDAPDIVRTLLYRPGFLARALLALTVPAMRGPSYWTVGEREYLAMSIARRHESQFCAPTHAEMVKLAGGPQDPAAVRPELAAAVEFVTSLTDAPAVPAGLPAEAVRDTLRVALVWEVVNRLANAFGFALRGDQLHSGTKALHRFGYKFPGFLLAGGPRPTGDEVADLRHAVLEAPAVTDPALRAAAASGAGVPDEWASYVDLVRTGSHRITDADVAALVVKHGEDEVYEVTVAAAVGAALEQYDAGQRVSRGD